MPFAGYGGGFWHPYGMPMMPPSQLQQPASSSSSQTGPMEPSSDPPDDAAQSIYPRITNFVDSLAQKHPERNIEGLGMFFSVNDYLYIDEILDLTKDEVMGLGFGITVGKAKFILKQVDDEMRRVERDTGCKRRKVRPHA